MALALLLVACEGSAGEPWRPGPDEPPVVCDGTRDVGDSPMQRLTGEHYDNVVRDLLGVEGHPSDALELDERNGVFTANVSTPVSQLVVEQYMQVAEQVAAQATVDVDALVGCDRASRGDEACASEFIARFGRRAYRRPLEAEERAAYEALYAAYATPGFANGIRLVVSSMLQSPHFLYRPELLPDGGGEGEIVEVTPYELASRLSFFLWASAPDDALLDSAERGGLDTPEGVEAEAQRMLDDPRALDTIESFHLQWLGLHELEAVSKDPGLFPEYDARLREAMRQETTRFADYVIRTGDGRLSTLLTGSFTFIDADLAPIYGVSLPPDHHPAAPVALDPTRRAGILTQPGVLAAHAHNQTTSPTLRGRLVRENFFCHPLEDPPPGVDTTLPEIGPDASTRERLAIHMQGEACSSCHVLTDPIGFGFEHYDAIGRWRETEGPHAIDPTVDLEQTDVDGTYADGVELAQQMSQSAQVTACVARTWFRYATARPGAGGDECNVRELERRLQETDDLPGLLRAIVVSESFRYRRL